MKCDWFRLRVPLLLAKYARPVPCGLVLASHRAGRGCTGPRQAGDVFGRQASFDPYGLLRRWFLEMLTLIHSRTPTTHNGGKTNPATVQAMADHRQTISPPVQDGFGFISLLQ